MVQRQQLATAESIAPVANGKKRPRPFQLLKAASRTGGAEEAGGVEETLLRSAFDAGGLEPLQTRRVPMDELVLEPEVLGMGAFGEVHRATWAATGTMPRVVAVKVMHRHRITKPELERFKRSLALELDVAAHSNLCCVHCWACNAVRGQLLVVMELCASGSLAAALETGVVAVWGLPLKLRIASDLSSGLSFLHGLEPPIVHRDIKPENLLFDDVMHCKICDLGVSRVEDTKNTMTSLVGTLLFLAPEQLSHQRYTVAVDIWAAGCVLACLVLNVKQPYQDHADDSSLLNRIMCGKTRPSTPPDSILHTAVQACLQFDAGARPTAGQLASQVDSLLSQHE
eukprot:CAMPEP_0183346604 /NCGR_PEP_ID=MMETSP0164_2-20130417/11675_1 /TAXON_ID=221442 /ORGANISM="Coccolithus pelagicus ssp braarudi, Strain PLY182g" /LENGTH=340 /DNA_ID=CAMNT_0025517905 /DNA_START=621 /DNA_END=1643 /DNA_ORIENTATION=+